MMRLLSLILRLIVELTCNPFWAVLAFVGVVVLAIIAAIGLAG